MAGRRKIVLNAGVVERLFPGEDPIGKCVKVHPDECVEVVGISEPYRARVAMILAAVGIYGSLAFSIRQRP